MTTETTTEYAVFAETHEGNIHTLRRGFFSRDAAEDHPVQMSLWKRVWVDLWKVTQPESPPEAAPRPWTWTMQLTVSGPGHIYLVDASGRKIAVLWGKKGERELNAELIVDAVNDIVVDRPFSD